MKTLNDYITEWKASSSNASSINAGPYFIYKTETYGSIRIFNSIWPQFDYYKDKAYLNGEKINIDKFGYTEEGYSKGTHFFYI